MLSVCPTEWTQTFVRWFNTYLRLQDWVQSVISREYPLVSGFRKMLRNSPLHVIKTPREHGKTEDLGLMSATYYHWHHDGYRDKIPSEQSRWGWKTIFKRTLTSSPSLSWWYIDMFQKKKETKTVIHKEQWMAIQMNGMVVLGHQCAVNSGDTDASYIVTLP